MKKYEEPNMMVLRLNEYDVITASELTPQGPAKGDTGNWDEWFPTE